MSRSLLTALVAAALVVMASPASPATPREPEGCQAVNPGQPTCSYTAAMDAETPVSGAMGIGNWVVTIKRPGEKKPIVLKPDSGGGVVEFAIQQGDKVTAKAIDPGTAMTVGSVQP